MKRPLICLLFALTFASTAAADEKAIESEPSVAGEDFFVVEHNEKPLPTDEPALPWFWQEVRKAVEASEERLPHHEEDEFYVVLSPTRVSNGFETVAGVGVRGRF